MNHSPSECASFSNFSPTSSHVDKKPLSSSNSEDSPSRTLETPMNHVSALILESLSELLSVTGGWLCPSHSLNILDMSHYPGGLPYLRLRTNMISAIYIHLIFREVTREWLGSKAGAREDKSLCAAFKLDLEHDNPP